MKTMNKKYIIYMLLLIILLITTNIVYVSAYNNINFKNITSEDGLSQGTETIIQDDQGYIWLELMMDYVDTMVMNLKYTSMMKNWKIVLQIIIL